MANTEVPGGETRTGGVEQPQGEPSIGQYGGGTRADQTTFAAYSFSSPEFRQAIWQLPSVEKSRAARQLLTTAENPMTFTAISPEVPALLKAPTRPESTFATSMTAGPEKSKDVDRPVLPALPTTPAEQIEDKNQIIDPCTKKVVNVIPAPADMPKALDSVKDRDPELFKQIQAKVIDPRYTGEMGNITISTHNKKGLVNGCVFVQNAPYWESGPAAQALVDVNKILEAKGKKLEADPLNGAGRTLAQEEAIAWRNSGLHAKVGKSNHGFGKAEDFKPDQNPDSKKQPWEDPFVNATLHAHGWRQGDSWGPLKNDLHHWSFAGPGPVTDGHSPTRKPTHSTHHRHR